MKRDPRLTLSLGFATAAVLALTQGPVGFVRDEGYYFTAAQSYEAWLRALPASLGQTEQYWSYNFEHPGLAKLLFALSHLVFTTWTRWLPDALSWRLPAFVFAGVLTHCLAVLALQRSRRAAVLAPLLFWCAERTFFHGHLAAFDVPICALFAAVAVAWLDALESPSRRTGLWLAFTYGCALAVKHNAWFLPPVLLIHALLSDFAGSAIPGSAIPDGAAPGGASAHVAIPDVAAPHGARDVASPGGARASLSTRLRTLAWLALSPVVLFAGWPLLWHEPLRHLGDWIAFHTHHVHYAWEYLGRELRAPPFPIEYPLVVDALALPLPLVLLLTAAGVSLLAGFARRTLSPQRLLELGLAGASVLPFMLRTTPIFGGLKHWLVFVALLTPEAAALLVRAADLSGVRRAVPALALATLLPGVWQVAHLHPYGTSAYGELAGGVPGAASLGMQRQYWSNNVTAVLPWLNAHCPPGARVFFHEVNVESYRAYQQSGALRPDLRYANGPADSDYAALQWHREFRDREPETWMAFGTHRPAFGLYLDEVPQVVVYARPGLPGAP